MKGYFLNFGRPKKRFAPHLLVESIDDLSGSSAGKHTTSSHSTTVVRCGGVLVFVQGESMSVSPTLFEDMRQDNLYV